MLRKLISLCTGCIIFAIAFPSNTFAEEVPALQNENTVSSVINLYDYYDYLEENRNIPSAKSKVEIDAKDFASNNNAKAVISNHYQGAKGAVVVWESEEGSLDWNISIPETGLYQIGFLYYNTPGRENPIKINVKIDGEYPFPETKNLELARMWKDAGGIRKDANGNEFSPKQEELHGWYKQWIEDPKGLATSPFLFALEKGIHMLTIESVSEPFALDKIYLSPPENVKSYAETMAEYNFKKYKEYNGDHISIQGESADLKTSNDLIAKSDSSDPSVYPTDPFKSKVNYIGSTNWQQPGETINWKFEIPSDGLYKLGFKFRQSYLLNCDSYRKLKIDGKVPFTEADAISFPYGFGWQYKEFLDRDRKPSLIYLSEGEHTLSLEVTIGPLADFNREMQNIVSSLGTIYRKIVMITGDSPDPNRDYNLFGQIPDLRSSLESNLKVLTSIAGEIDELTGKKAGTNSITIRNMSSVIKLMLDYPYRAQHYKDDFYTNYCSINSWLNEMKNMPLDIDVITFGAPDKPYRGQSSSILEKVSFSAQRFIASFFADYNNVSHESSNEGGKITLWLNWGRDQVQAINSLIQSSFTPEHKIGVDIRVVNTSIIQAILSGNGPDCSLMLSRAQPVNYAMRGALYDLKKFGNDFESVKEWFMPSSLRPYELNGGCYALPDSQQFNMMFYRTDIMNELGIELPKTWQEMLGASAILARYNMQIGLPYTQITEIGQTDAGMGALNLFPTLLQQFGAKMYANDLSETDLTNPKSIEAFKFWTDFYTKYKFPLTYDLYNRFRTGELPIAISSYTLYSTLKVAAPEIDGRWTMAPIPGFENRDGTINNIEAAGGTGAVILNMSKNKKQAWDFLKWWVSEDTQYRYSADVESILGVAGRHSTANVKALSRLAWDKGDLDTLMEQWEKVNELPEIAGGYYVPRIIDQAFWNTVINKEIPQDMLDKWSQYANIEIARKRDEYNLQ